MCNNFKIFNDNTQIWFNIWILETILVLEIQFEGIKSISLEIQTPEILSF